MPAIIAYGANTVIVSSTALEWGAILRGSRSRLVPAELFAYVQEVAPSGTYFETIEDAGHHVLLDQPLRVVEAVGRIARKMH